MHRSGLGIFYFLIFLFLIIGYDGLAFPVDNSSESCVTILIIHSYNREYQWTENINTGILSRLENIPREHLIYTEYLDWKRFPDPENLDNLYKVFKHKYANIKIDIIVTSDDKALEFAAKHRAEIFSDAPIVFTGVYKESLPTLTNGQENITGVYEKQDIDTTFHYAMRIQPAIRAVYTVNDLSESGQALERRIKDTITRIVPNIPFMSLSNQPIESITDFVSALTPNDCIIIGSYAIDADGRTYSGEKLITDVATAANKTPVYVLNTHHLGTGALGGNLLSPFKLGENAGIIANRILAGASVFSISPVYSGNFIPLFDYKVMKRLQIQSLNLPANAKYLNKENTFITKYQNELIVAVVVFLVLLLLLDILFINYRRARKLAQVLATHNTQIGLLNETLAQSEEELRQQYTELIFIKEELEASEERYRLSALGSNDALWDWNYETKQTHYTSRWYEMTGYAETNTENFKFEDIIHPDDRELYDRALMAHVHGKTDQFLCEIRIKTANGTWKWISIRGKGIQDSSGHLFRFAGSVTDIDDRKQKEDEIENLAYYDQLTSLPNRTLAIDMAVKMLEDTEDGLSCGLMFIDIDNFKYVNDTFGHTVGDKVLIQTAQNLSSLVNENISIARFGGDEFILLVSNTTEKEMGKYARLALTLLSRKIKISGRYHFLTVSAGVALYPDHASDFEGLFQKADAALHRAKSSGKTRFEMYTNIIQQELVRRMELESGLRSAIENNELYVAYQPQIDLKTNRIAGIEVLARWNDPVKGNISPAEFIPIAEESGQIEKIGFFVLRSAAHFIKRAENFGYTDFTVSVNVSVRQLEEPEFVKQVIQLVTEEDVDPARISLEITESFMIEALDLTLDKLNHLKAAGFKLSLDDFGKGYSSLSCLKSLPVHYIKIDKSFIDDITTSGSDVSLAQNIIELSHKLGLTVVAEGVEVAAQRDYLKQNNCDLIQGFYYSKPEDEDTVLNQLELSFD